MLLQASFVTTSVCGPPAGCYGLLPGLKRSLLPTKRDTARAMKGHMGFFNTHPFTVTFVISIILAMGNPKQDVNSIRAPKLPWARRS